MVRSMGKVKSLKVKETKSDYESCCWLAVSVIYALTVTDLDMPIVSGQH